MKAYRCTQHFQGVLLGGIPFTQYHILFLHCRQPPLKKGNSQMESFIQDNPSASTPSAVCLEQPALAGAAGALRGHSASDQD